MSYSQIEDVVAVYPNVSGVITNSDYAGSSPETLISSCQTLSYNWINSTIRPYTKTPNTDVDALVLVEAHYTAYLIIKGTSTLGDDATLNYANTYRDEAARLLKEAEFPASYSTPIQASGFVGTGNITLTVNDAYTPTANWEARYQSNNQWQIWNSVEGDVGVYNYVSDAHFPNPSDTTTDSQAAVKSITVDIENTGTAFVTNDTWRWKTWSSTRKRKGIKFRRIST